MIGDALMDSLGGALGGTNGAGTLPPPAPDPAWATAATLQEFKSASERAYLVAKLRENGKPTQLAIEKGCALRVPNGFGHDDFWHRKLLPTALREVMLLD